MTKLKWRNRRQGWNGSTTPTRRIEAAANRILAGKSPKSAAIQVIERLGPYKPGTYQTRDGIWITVGADCPWNTTPGIRQVHNFANAKEAREAGFNR